MLFSHNFDICQVLDYFKLKVPQKVTYLCLCVTYSHVPPHRKLTWQFTMSLVKERARRTGELLRWSQELEGEGEKSYEGSHPLLFSISFDEVFKPQECFYLLSATPFEIKMS